MSGHITKTAISLDLMVGYRYLMISIESSDLMIYYIWQSNLNQYLMDYVGFVLSTIRGLVKSQEIRLT